MPWALLAVLGVLVAGAAALGVAGNPTAVLGAAGCPSSSGSRVPDYVGLPAARVEACVAASGSTAAPLRVPSTEAKGLVISQWPDQSASPVLTHADTVYLFVSAGPWHRARQVLPLAVGPPVGDECALPVRTTSDGNARPLTCPGGGLNVEAWDFYVQLHPALMSAGPRATERTVLRAYCGFGEPSEIGITGQELDSVLFLAADYYGWRLAAPDPSQVTEAACAKVEAPLG